MLADLSTLLQQIAENYDDLDIQDRARFYYQLMLTVSADKVTRRDHTHIVLLHLIFAAISYIDVSIRLHYGLQPVRYCRRLVGSET
jgi:hypothetical protein